MTTRQCLWCGVPEQRWKDAGGQEHVNLNPLDGLCVSCLIEYAKGVQRPAVQGMTWRDHRQAAAGREQE